MYDEDIASDQGEECGCGWCLFKKENTNNNNNINYTISNQIVALYFSFVKD